jgi:outer membrane biosynthesis protein TonB
MTEHQSSRTLVKSAPELWAECSDAASLARHLGAFGEIRITKLEPETAVAWEGAAASGTVRLESSGWGTRVTLTVKEDAAPPAGPEPAMEEPEAVEPEAVEPEAVEPEAVEPEPEPEAEEPEPEAAEPEPVAEAPPVPEPEPPRPTGEDALVAALDSLGMAHHRPYSRA